VKVEWLPVAERSRENQLAYIAERDPWAAIDMGDAIEAAVSRLADYHTSAGPAGSKVRGSWS